MAEALFLVACPVPVGIEVSVERWISKHLTHTEMAFVLPYAKTAMRELTALDCTLEVPAVEPGAPCLRVVAGSQQAEAAAVLERWALDVVESDPYQKTTLDYARALFGLPALPKRTLRQKLSSMMSALLRRAR